jgi:hypothetical protein
VLSRDVVSSPSDPRYRQPMSLDTEARLKVVGAAHLYTMPDFHLRLTTTNGCRATLIMLSVPG